MKSIQGIAVLLAAVFTVTITNAQEKGFKTDPATGVVYRFIKHDKKGTAYSEDKVFAHVAMVWSGKNAKGDADSVYYDSHVKGGDSIGAILIPLRKSFHGCLEEGIMMMAVGDSAVFKINGDSLYLKAFHARPAGIPHFINGSTLFTFRIKLLGLETRDEMMASKQAEMKSRMEKLEASRKQEPLDITAYLQKNNLNVTPDADSIFYLQTTKGNGQAVTEGDSIEVKYRGTLLDGKVFDPGSRNLKMVYAKNMSLVQGWVSILGKMNQGDKVRVLIPSSRGYGAGGSGPDIKGFTPLIFEMEMIRVKSNK